VILLERFFHGPHCTIGRILFGGKQLYSIERPWLQNKPFKSCIPDGVYDLRRYSSERFPGVWEVVDVPGRTHILFHAANWADQVEGCIAPGRKVAIRHPGQVRECAVWDSRTACGILFEYLGRIDIPTLTIMSTACPLEDCL